MAGCTIAEVIQPHQVDSRVRQLLDRLQLAVPTR
jgi:hypothetical protein